MGMRRIGSRKITVDGQLYRWRIRPRPTISEGDYGHAMTVAVEHESCGCVLLLVADGPRPGHWSGKEDVVITPKTVASSIRRAIALGWQPQVSGPHFISECCSDAPANKI